MGSTIPDEQAEYWLPFPHDDLALRCAVLHQQRRTQAEAQAAAEVETARRTVASVFISGRGVEVGAGSRPFPIPGGARCFYGDVRDQAELSVYFGTDKVSVGGTIDAQTMQGIPRGSLDFAISAHVIEHLHDPLGSIRATLGCLRPGGVFVLVVPELTQTWDRLRPPTTLAHAIADLADGGTSTLLQSYVEHLRYVAPVLTGQATPEEDIDRLAREAMAVGHDLHMHAWRAQDFRELLDYAAPRFGFDVVAHVPVANENIFVLRRRAGGWLARLLGRGA